MFNIKIVEGKRKDMESVIKMGKELQSFHTKIDDYYRLGSELNDKENKKWLRDSFGKENFKLLLVKKGNEIIGYAICEIEKGEGYARPKKVGQLANIYIRENYRGKGIGKKLFDIFLDWFRSKGIKHISLYVDSRNDAAIKAYKKYGFFEYRKKMRLDLK